MIKQSIKIILILNLLFAFGLQSAMAQCKLKGIADISTHADAMPCYTCLDIDAIEIQDTDFTLLKTSPDLEQVVFIEIEPQIYLSHTAANANILSIQDKRVASPLFTIDTVKAFPPPYQSTERLRI